MGHLKYRHDSIWNRLASEEESVPEILITHRVARSRLHNAKLSWCRGDPLPTAVSYTYTTCFDAKNCALPTKEKTAIISLNTFYQIIFLM
jgi:hypothetical protein